MDLVVLIYLYQNLHSITRRLILAALHTSTSSNAWALIKIYYFAHVKIMNYYLLFLTSLQNFLSPALLNAAASLKRSSWEEWSALMDQRRDVLRQLYFLRFFNRQKQTNKQEVLRGLTDVPSSIRIHPYLIPHRASTKKCQTLQ